MTDTTPDFIYGTAWKEDRTARLTKLAIECGFRAIDTANQRKHYHEAQVGQTIAETHDKTVPQVIFRFAIQLGIVPLTGTTSEEHMNQDLAVTEFELSDDAVAAIDTIARR